MSVVEWREIGAGREGEKNAQFARTYTRIFRAETDDASDEASVVLAYSEVPVPALDVYPGDSSAYCVSSTARQEVEDYFKAWIVTSKYTTQPSNTPDQFTTNPLLDAALYSLSFDQHTTVARQALRCSFTTGAPLGPQPNSTSGLPGPIQNSVGDVLRPGIEVDACRATYIVRKNEAYVSPAMAGQLVNAVNISAWNGCPPRTVKVKNISTGEIQQRNNISYYQVTYEFHINPQTWDLVALNRGTRYYKTLAGGIQAVTAVPDGQEVTLYTDAEGVTYGTIVPPSATPSLNQIYLRWRYYTEVDFNAYFNF